MTQLEYLLSVGVLTGSKAFNCATLHSDWDIVVLEFDYGLYVQGTVINHTDFNSPERYTKEQYGFDLSEFSEFKEEPFVEYDKHTIWGPLTKIIKYVPNDSKDLINLFVYENICKDILPKFRELNNLMNFIYGSKLKDKSVRIKAFTEIISKVGITDFML